MKFSSFFIFFIVIVCGILVSAQSHCDNVPFKGPLSYTNITAIDFLPIYKSYLPQTVVIDVREPDEYTDAHIPNAHNLPLSSLNTTFHLLPVGAQYNIYVHCWSGFRSKQAVTFLAQTGLFNNLYNLQDGFQGWELVAGPIAHGEDPCPLDHTAPCGR